MTVKLSANKKYFGNKKIFLLSGTDGRKTGNLSIGRSTATGCWSSRVEGRWSSPVPGPRISVRFCLPVKQRLSSQVRPHNGSQSISVVFICFDIPGFQSDQQSKLTFQGLSNINNTVSGDLFYQNIFR